MDGPGRLSATAKTLNSTDALCSNLGGGLHDFDVAGLSNSRFR